MLQAGARPGIYLSRARVSSGRDGGQEGGYEKAMGWVGDGPPATSSPKAVVGKSSAGEDSSCSTGPKPEPVPEPQ